MIEMSLPVDWNMITDEDFEELCYDILQRFGFVNLKWIGRRGKDRGRDILAEKIEKELESLVTIRRWLIQCKRYLSRAPSPSDLAGAVAWADAHSPNVLFFMMTNSLSAETHDWLKKIESGKKYTIHTYEEKQLRDLCSKSPDLLKKYFKRPVKQATLQKEESRVAVMEPYKVRKVPQSLIGKIAFRRAIVYARKVSRKTRLALVDGHRVNLMKVYDGFFILEEESKAS